MDAMIAEYEAQISSIKQRIAELGVQLRGSTPLRTKEREHLIKRMDMLEEEMTDLIYTVKEMRRGLWKRT